MLENEKNTFELSSLFPESICLHENIFPQTRNQHSKVEADPLLQLLHMDPYEVLGFHNFSEPNQVSNDTKGTPIQEFYKGLNIFITGGTGFIGKVLIEKLLRSVPHLGQIFILIREKKGKSSKERFEELLEDKVFLRMKTEVPNFRSMITCLNGDISEPDLGLTEEERQNLQSLVHVVFHIAANVRFDMPLRTAVNSNVLGSRKVLDLAKGMNHLKSYVHVSTAYSNCVRRVIEEKCYKLGFNYKDILNLLEEKTDDFIQQNESRILQGWPNTYTFSKALCEAMLMEEAGDLPISVFRPSVVWPSHKEPLRGWTDNIYGANGLLMAIVLGVLHILRSDTTLTLDIVPVDHTVNAMIAVAWESATQSTLSKETQLPVYNHTSCPRITLIWKNFIRIGFKWIDAFPYEQAIYYCSFMATESYLFYEIGHFFLHTIPGMVLDRIAVITGREPRLTKVYSKLHMAIRKVEYFMFGTWEFRSENISALWKKLTIEDQEKFNFDIANVDLEESILIGKLGIKYFILKEHLENMPRTQKKWKWLKLVHQSVLVVSGLAALKLLVFVARSIPI